MGSRVEGEIDQFAPEPREVDSTLEAKSVRWLKRRQKLGESEVESSTAGP